MTLFPFLHASEAEFKAQQEAMNQMARVAAQSGEMNISRAELTSAQKDLRSKIVPH
jgi:hypothetical protein